MSITCDPGTKVNVVDDKSRSKRSWVEDRETCLNNVAVRITEGGGEEREKSEASIRVGLEV